MDAAAGIAEMEERVGEIMREIDIAAIAPHPKNPRKNLGDLSELTASIKTFGVLQNLTVVPDGTNGYVCLCGHRRLAAAEAAGLQTVPCTIADDMSEKTQVQIMLLENMQRNDLTLQEEAQGLQMMLDLGSSIAEIVRDTGMSETKVRHRVKMNELDQETLAEKLTGQIQINDLIKLERVKDIEKRNELLKEIGTNNFEWKLREAVKKEKMEETLALIKELGRGVVEVKKDVYTWQYSTHGRLLYGATEQDVMNFLNEAIEIEETKGKKVFIAKQTAYEGFTICEEREKSPGAEEESPEKKAKKEEKDARVRNLKDMRARVLESWEDFIKDFCRNKSEQQIETHHAAILETLLANQVVSYDTPDMDDLKEILGLENDEEKSNEEEYKDALRLAKGRPWAMAAASAYALVEPGDWSNTWSHQNETFEAAKAERYQKTAAFLSSLGYEVSDDEMEFIYGTSELYRGGRK